MKRLTIVLLALTCMMSCKEEKAPETQNTTTTKPENFVPSIEYTLGESLPHDTNSYTEGLLFHDQQLFESTGSPQSLSNTKSILGPVDPKTGKIVIKAELDKIVTAYISQPNTAATWAQIKGTAEGFLYTYYLNGKLMGTKKEQAFYVKMGTETMTAADVANKKMILVAGIAVLKPAEFTLIRVEKLCR